jgi:hypothetical protein
MGVGDITKHSAGAGVIPDIPLDDHGKENYGVGRVFSLVGYVNFIG